MGGSHPEGEVGSEPDPRARASEYWRANLRLVVALLVVWAIASFGLSIVLVEPLNAFSLRGFPLGFWFAQQGSIEIFVVILLVYCAASARLARRYGVDH